ncbi:hypothetical protein [Nesterenkonia muleiensis]|uniref:hypothetical protein n=1 Tax=Nesterenkonia muleiensis TaxID=2282648 RepID=UPI000E709037|nr:hypothetical protein [Nesterenkonia muleiensis]
MRHTTWTSALSILGVALLVASCAADTPNSDNESASIPSVEPESSLDTVEVSEDSGAEVVVEHLQCDDPEALEAKAEHNADRDQPVGWPLEERQAGKLPDPLCHPDYLEIGEWVHFEEHYACCEGIETSNIVHDGTRSQDSINEGLWEQSMARFQWSEEANRNR